MSRLPVPYIIQPLTSPERKRVATGEILLSYPRARVVIASKYNDDQTREAAREGGACGYVLKENLIAIRKLLLETGP